TMECNLAISVNALGRFRVNVFRQRGDVAMVIRFIKGEIPSIEELFLPQLLKNLIMEKRGLILVVGSTGSGKSTTLASMIDYRNQHATGHILTIEDPIEFLHKHKKSLVNQREIGLDSLSYENALKNALREAPDVILIGEIRDAATMQHALAYAETGHLCLSTLHANNANQALDRILHFFPPERHTQLWMDLSLNLRAIVAQQLVPTPDGQGRRAVVEVLLNTPLASDLIRKGEVTKLKELMQRSNEQGMQTFDQALYTLYSRGEITYEDAIAHADSSNDLRLMIKLQKEGGDGLMDSAPSGLQIEDDPVEKAKFFR
ncbi:MAG: PilT/PilU family type 4a pilus ATPase, partial [Pseudomonadales bacterium]|nr:PilT/PilU family type 4a pilus ATPase [Pseudomonadales bacterium]